jgi:hypothetical protein
MNQAFYVPDIHTGSKMIELRNMLSAAIRRLVERTALASWRLGSRPKRRLNKLFLTSVSYMAVTSLAMS